MYKWARSVIDFNFVNDIYLLHSDWLIPNSVNPNWIFVTNLIRKCVAECPPGTTALLSSIRAKLRAQNTPNYVREELKCEVCSPSCAECLRPGSEYDCTACPSNTYLAPFLSPDKPLPSITPSIARLISSASKMRGSKVMVGSCVPRCPSRYFANETTKLCEQ